MSQKQISILKQQFAIKDGRPTITSQQVAEAFGKRHDHVLRDIETLGCSEEFRLPNFEETICERENPKGGAPIKSKMYIIQKDGFIVLAMGYQGRAAFRLKEAYIMAFNAMAEELASGMALTREGTVDALLNLCREAGRAGYRADFIDNIVRYRRMGHSQLEIGRLVCLPKSTVQVWLNKAAAAGISLPKRVASHLSAMKKKREEQAQKAARDRQLCLPGMEVQA